jgi:hypothetical protein
MADGGYLLIFRGMTTDQLLDLQSTMYDQLTNLGNYSSMSAGGKSWTRDMRALMAQLEALQFVLNERSLPYGYAGKGVIDFSGSQPGWPPGTQEDLNY